MYIFRSIGELVIVKLDDEKISRAYILELLDEGKFKVAALEYGQVVDVDAVFEVPDELLGYDEFLCVCEAPATFVAVSYQYLFIFCGFFYISGNFTEYFR